MQLVKTLLLFSLFLLSGCALLKEEYISHIRVHNLTAYDIDSLSVMHHKTGKIKKGGYSEYLVFVDAESNINESFNLKIGLKWIRFGPADELGLPRLDPIYYTLEVTKIVWHKRGRPSVYHRLIPENRRFRSSTGIESD